MDLNDIRREIDRVDDGLLRLFLERMRLSERVALYKRERAMPIYNPEREALILNDVARKAGAEAEPARRLFTLLMTLSKEKQASMGKLYGLIGGRLAHSDSRRVHEKLGLKDYGLYELDESQLDEFLNNPYLGGLNVTIPLKRAVAMRMDSLTREAERTGSVNCVCFKNGAKTGHNTDVFGFKYMAARAGMDFTGKRALVFGGGVGARAAAGAAMDMGAKGVCLITRSGEHTYDNLDAHADAQILINATPVGMYPDVCLMAADPARFPRAEYAIDLIYNPRRTDFLERARELGIKCAGGLSMLAAQAWAAERFFNTGEQDDELIADIDLIERVCAEVARETASIALIGMPGAGKTAIGRALSDMTGREFIDTDERIAADAGASASELIRTEGIERFREREARAIFNASLSRGCVVATGGGAMLDPKNARALRGNARVYHIRRDAALLSRERRPLSEGVDLRELAREREPYYARARDAVIVNSGAPEAAARAIWEDFCEHIGD